MIENICTAVLRDGSKLYQHFKSIDYPVGTYFIIDNSCGQDQTVKKALEKIFDKKSKYIDDIKVLTTNQNTGYPGAVNLAIKQNTNFNYWLFTGFDWYLARGELERLSIAIDSHPNGMTLGQGDDEMCGIVLTPKLIQEVGLLDENFYPGYFEDNDYRYRQKLAGVSMTSFPLNNCHIRSSTLNSCETFKQKNQYTFAANLDYYTKKWGGSPGNEIYRTPFHKGHPIQYWQFDPVRTEQLRWM
jgi:hypothetical protein